MREQIRKAYGKSDNQGVALAWAVIMLLVVVALLACILPLAASSIRQADRNNYETQTYYTAKSVVDSIIKNLQEDSTTEGSTGYEIVKKAKEGGVSGTTWKVAGLEKEMGTAVVTVKFDKEYLYVTAKATIGSESTSLTAQLYKNTDNTSTIVDSTKLAKGPKGIMVNDISVIDASVDTTKDYTLVMEDEEFPYSLMLLKEKEAQVIPNSSIIGTVISQSLKNEGQYIKTENIKDYSVAVKAMGDVIYDNSIIDKNINDIIALGNIRLSNISNKFTIYGVREVTDLFENIANDDRRYYSLYSAEDITVKGSVNITPLLLEDKKLGAYVGGKTVSLIGENSTNNKIIGISLDKTSVIEGSEGTVKVNYHKGIEALNYINLDNVRIYTDNRELEDSLKNMTITCQGVININNSFGKSVIGYLSDVADYQSGAPIGKDYVDIIGGEVNIIGNNSVIADNYILIDGDIYSTDKFDIRDSSNNITKQCEGVINIINNGSNPITISGNLYAKTINIISNNGPINIYGNLTADNINLTSENNNIINIDGNVSANGSLVIKALNGNISIANSQISAGIIDIYGSRLQLINSNGIYSVTFNRYKDYSNTLYNVGEGEEYNSIMVSGITTLIDMSNITPEHKIYELNERYITDEIYAVEKNGNIMPFDLVEKDGKWAFINEKPDAGIDVFQMDSAGVTYATLLNYMNYPAATVTLTKISEDVAASVYYVDEPSIRSIVLDNEDGNYYIIVRNNTNLTITDVTKKGTNNNLFFIVQDGATLNINMAGKEFTGCVFGEEAANINIQDNTIIDGDINGGKLKIGSNVKLQYTMLVDDIGVEAPLVDGNWIIMKYEKNIQ